MASRDLRNRTADVLRQVVGGTPVTITVNGEPVADITAYRSGERAFLSRREMVDVLQRHHADPKLRDDLRDLAGDDTDDLGPLE